MNIFTACLNTESNTFSPLPTGIDDFVYLTNDQFLADPYIVDGKGPVSVWRSLCEEYNYKHHFGLLALAEPSGVIVRSVYESMRDELLFRIAETKTLDIILLDLHGAMVAEGYPDCEGDLLSKIRVLVGDKVVIAIELDLHGHISQSMLDHADIIVGLKEYPHTDINERAEEVFHLAVKAKRRLIKPTMAIFDCKMIGIFPTTSDCMRLFVSQMYAEEATELVLSMTLMHGFPWGDTPDSGIKMLVITNNDYQLAESIAMQFGMKFFALREQVKFDSIPLNEALLKATKSDNFPVVVADQSDNPGGGAPSDSTFALKWLIDHNIQTALIAFIYDPEVIKVAKIAGVGSKIQVRVGGKMSAHSGQPVDILAKVIGIAENYIHTFPQLENEDFVQNIGDVVVLRVNGIDLILSSKRSQCFSPDFLDYFGLVASNYKVIIPKSTQHFYSSFSKISNEIIYMSAFGAIAPNVKLIPYKVTNTEFKYPWCQNPHIANQADTLTNHL